ncbi:BRCT domain-containing protein [Kitasatospora sp. NPDC056789]|uniref:BRCT domain-containing protein n=1 Tax=Kitasatospora sp. NPDC056789 TaxID=3345945 RepID=UPI0036855502
MVVTGSVTGVLAELSRNELNELIERAGGKTSSSVSKCATLLVVGETAGSKRAMAEDLGVPVRPPGELPTAPPPACRRPARPSCTPAPSRPATSAMNSWTEPVPRLPGMPEL